MSYEKERRRRRRYEIRLPVDVTGVTSLQPVIAGWSIDISPAGVRIASDVLERYQPFGPGATVMVAAVWPARRNGMILVRLILIGDVIRCTSSDMTVRITRHYFET